jgi:hypothetical protein
MITNDQNKTYMKILHISVCPRDHIKVENEATEWMSGRSSFSWKNIDKY